MYKQMRKISILSLVIGLAIPAFPAMAQDEEPVRDESTTRCISVRSIRSTDIIDDRNVLFYMRGDVVYQNILSRRCPGLAREDRFSYKVSAGQLCDLDVIYVLYSDARGMRDGPACGLGQFIKMTREDAKALKEGPKEAPPPKPLPMPEPEEVGGDDETEE